MSLYKLSNRIFAQGLSVKELCVYAYLCSIHVTEQTLNREAVIHVKQTTIGENCGISSVQTVKKVMDGLMEKGFVTQLQRSVKYRGHKGTYYYGIKQLPLTDGYFYAERRVFGQLVPRQLVVYLFLCKAHSTKYGYSWNSYNDMAAQIRMKRETVIATIQELCEMHLIAKQLMRSRENNRVFVDNRYFIVQRETGTIKKKKPVWGTDFFTWFTGSMVALVNSKPILVYHGWRTLSSPFYLLRGSPQIVTHILNPNIFSSRKRKNKVILLVFCRFILYSGEKFFEKSTFTFTLRVRDQHTSARCGMGGAVPFFFFLVAKPEVLYENSRASSSRRIENFELTIFHEYARMEEIQCNKI